MARVKPTATATIDSLPPWAVYGDAMRWPVTQHLFLAEAARLVGAAICEPWDDAVLLGMTRPDSPDIPSADDAFEDGVPIAEVHAAFGPAVRTVLSPASFSERHLRNDEKAWVRSHVPDPEGGSPLPALLLRARNGDDRADPISFAHWEFAALQSAEDNNLFDAACRATAAIAGLITRMAFEGAIQTFARRIGGDLEAVLLTKFHWAIDDPLSRLASCAISLEHPFDAGATPTHLLFVAREGFAAALASYTPDHLIGLVGELEDGVRRKPDYYGATVTEVANRLQEKMGDPGCASWRSTRFKDDIQTKFGSAGGGVVFDRAWKIATKQFPQFSLGGRPRLM